MSLSEPFLPLKCDHGLRRQPIRASRLTDVFQSALKAGKLLCRACTAVAWAHDTAHNEPRRLAEESHKRLAIVESLAAGASREAARAMSRHIMGGAKYWSRVLRDGPETPAPEKPQNGSPV